MSVVGILEYGVKVSTKDAENQLKGLNSKISKNGSKAFNKLSGAAGSSLAFVGRQLKRTAMAAGILGTALAGKAIKDAGAFQASLANVNTLLQVSQTEINGLGESIEKISLATGLDNELLSAATYDIVSSGITDTADALLVLEQATKLGVAGLGTTNEAVDLITSAMNSFGISAEDSDEAAALFFNSVADGKTTIAELSVAFGDLTPSALAAGVTFKEVQAATAALTTTGVKTSVAQNKLKVALDETSVSANKLDKAFVKNGFESANAAVKELGFVGALEELQDQAGLTDLEIKNLFGSKEGGQAAFTLLTSVNDKFKDSLNGSADSIAAFNRAFEIQQETIRVTGERLKAFSKDTLLDIGQAALPQLTSSLNGLLDTLEINAEGFESLKTKIGETLGSGLSSLVDGASNALSGLSTDAIGERFDQLVGIAKGAFNAIKDFFGTIFEAIGPSIGELFDEISIAFGGVEGDSKSFGETIGGFVGSALKSLVDLLVKAVQFFNENRVEILNVAGVIGGALSIGFQIAVGIIETIGAIMGPIIKAVGTFIDILKIGFDGIKQLAGLALRGLEKLGIVAEGTADSFLGLSDTINESAQISNLAFDDAYGNISNRLQTVAVEAANSSEQFRAAMEAQGISVETLAEDLASGALNAATTFDIINEAAVASQEQLGVNGEALGKQFTAAREDYNALADRSQEANERIIRDNTASKEAAISTLEEISTVSSGLSETFAASLAESGLNVQTLGEDLSSGAVNFQEASTIISTAIEASASELGVNTQLMRDELELTVPAAELFGESIQDAAIVAGDSMVESGAQIEGSSNEIVDSLDGITPSAETMADTMDVATDMSGDAIEGLLDTTQGASAGITDSLVGASQDIASDAVGGFTDFAQSGADAVDDITQSTQEGASQALAASQEIATSAAQGVAELPATFRQIAIDLVDGFTNGIRSRITTAATAAGELAAATSKAVRDNLEIKSPSKVFRELGGFTAEGFLIGIEEGAPDVINSMGSLTSGLTTEAEESNAKMKLNFTRAFKSISKVVEDSLDDANDAIKDFVSDNQKSQEKIRKELDKTGESIQSLTEDFEEQGRAAELAFSSDALGIVLDAESERESILENIIELEKELSREKLNQSSVAKQIKEENRELLSVTRKLRSKDLSEEDRIELQLRQIELKKELVELEERDSVLTKDEKLDSQQKSLEIEKELLKLKGDLASQEDILNLSNENQLVATEDLEEAKRNAALNPLEALIESFDGEKEARQIKFDEDLERLQQEEVALQDSLQAREDELTDFYSTIKNEDSAFTATYLSEIQTREAATSASIGVLIDRYNALAAARQRAGGGAIGGAGLPGFAEGGLTGNAPASKVVGVVHGQEHVVEAPLRRAFPMLDAGIELLRNKMRSGENQSSTTNNNQRTLTMNPTINNPMDLQLFFNAINRKIR